MVIIQEFYLPDKTTMFPVGTRVTLIRKKKNVWTMKTPNGKFHLRRNTKLAPVASVPTAQPAVAPSVAPAVAPAAVAPPPAPSPRALALRDFALFGRPIRPIRPIRSTPGPVVRPNINAARCRHWHRTPPHMFSFARFAVLFYVWNETPFSFLS